MIVRLSPRANSGDAVGSMNSTPVIIVLAAGLGSRFGGAQHEPTHKLSQPLGSTTVLGQTVQNAIESGLPVVVVTTQPVLGEVSMMVAGRDLVLMPLPMPMPMPTSRSVAGPGNLNGQRIGMGFSIAAGVAARPNAAGWLVLPGDMPLVQASTLCAVAKALPQHPVVYAQHLGRRGHPVGFAAELFSDLVQLSGDDGARRIVARYPSFGVEVSDAGVLIDIDTSADLSAVRASWVEASVANRPLTHHASSPVLVVTQTPAKGLAKER